MKPIEYRLKFGVLMLVVAATAFAVLAGAAETKLSADEIVRRSNNVAYYQGKDGRANVTMKIVDSQGRTRTRKMVLLRRDSRPDDEQKMKQFKADEFTGDQRFYVYFEEPSDWEKTVFLVWKHVKLSRDDDRWLYLPALDLVKRIAAGDERTSFAGSNFYYEDISGRNTNEDNHKLVNTSDKYYILKNTPKKPDLVEFKYYRMYIHRGTFLPIKVEYYNQQGEKYREYTVEKVKKIQGYWTVTQARMKDLESGGYTRATYNSVEYDIGLPKDIFTKRYLRQAPAKYLDLD
jgi:hypothetical protein